MTWHDGQKPGKGDLLLRLFSAAVLIPFALWMVWSGGLVLTLGCALFASIMAYEWVRMTRSPNLTVMALLAPLTLLAVHWHGLGVGLTGLGVCLLIVGLRHPVRRKKFAQALGFLYLVSMPIGLYLLREGPWDGVGAALIIMSIVWGSDSAAYFSGRGFGGPALHPDSPSKTWSGAIGAVIFSVACGALAAGLLNANHVAWLIMGAFISIFAQLGDMMESSIKRLYRIKDSSGLVPGHGGLLDRVDGLGFTAVFMVVIFYASPNLISLLGFAR